MSDDVSPYSLAQDALAAVSRAERSYHRHPKTGAIMLGEDCYASLVHATSTLASVVTDKAPIGPPLSRALEIVLSRCRLHDGVTFALRSLLKTERERVEREQLENRNG